MLQFSFPASSSLVPSCPLLSYFRTSMKIAQLKIALMISFIFRKAISRWWHTTHTYASWTLQTYYNFLKAVHHKNKTKHFSLRFTPFHKWRREFLLSAKESPLNTSNILKQYRNTIINSNRIWTVVYPKPGTTYRAYKRHAV